ncbi:MAG: DNA lyase, partial [Spirochaetota bacterium]
KPLLNQLKNILDKRVWLVKNIKGYGYKEASHFLRNIGFGDNIAILDRHIYKNLKLLNVIDEIPKSASPKKYIEIEQKMREFSKEINIPMAHLDFVLWYKEAGEIFK